MEDYIDRAIKLWLAAKYRLSLSEQTRQKYQLVITRFREWLQETGKDLDCDEAEIVLEAQQYAEHSARVGRVCNSTFGDRLSIISSFFEYVKKHRLFSNCTTNPISMIEKPRRQPYANVEAPNFSHVARVVSGIDRSTIQGARNYVLLAIYLETGCRLFEVQALRWGDVRIASGRLEDVEKPQDIRLALFFRRCKGGKTALHELSAHLSEALLCYLEMYYQMKPIFLHPSRPVLGSLTRHGEPLGKRGIERVAAKYLQLTVHDLRHANASARCEAGESLLEIKDALGHDNLETTSHYIHKLRPKRNPEVVKKVDQLLLGFVENA